MGRRRRAATWNGRVFSASGRGGGTVALSHFSLPPPAAQYGKADARWMKPWEPGTVSVEVPTVFVAGLGAIVILYGIIKNT